MKKSYLAICVLILSLCFSCNPDSEELILEINSIENTPKVNTNSIDSNAKIFSLCEIDGPTCGRSGQTVTYTYSTDLTMQNIIWSVVSGNLTLISGQGTNTATFLIGSSFFGGRVEAYGSGSPDCIASVQLLNCGPSGPSGGCACPLPVIDDMLCVSGGHPHWRFRVNGVNSGDQITWSINHGTVHTNPNQCYVIIEPNSGSIHGFTVYCRIDRTCSNGSIKTRTAYYTNYYGNNCETGTTGYIDSCGFDTQYE